MHALLDINSIVICYNFKWHTSEVNNQALNNLVEWHTANMKNIFAAVNCIQYKIIYM